MTPTDFLPATLLRRLAEAGVDFVVVGGIAMTAHGSDRNTFDLDICPEQSPQNLELLGSVLLALNARLRGIEEDVPFVPDARSLRGIQILTLDTDLGPLDILSRPDGSPPYARMRERAIIAEIDGTSVPVASVEDLLAMKRSAGREKDRLDVETLESHQRLRKRLGG